MLISKLIDAETIDHTLTLDRPQLALKGRTGLTTGQALHHIGEAMINPGQRVHIADGDREGHWYVENRIKDLLSKLELKHFVIEHPDHIKGSYTLRYDIYRKVDLSCPNY